MSIKDSISNKTIGSANILLWFVTYVMIGGKAMIQLKVSENKEAFFPRTDTDPLNSIHGPTKGLWT